MKQNLLAILLAPALVFLSGCASDHGAYPPVNATVNNLESTAKFVLLDKGAQRSVTCVELQESRLSDGRFQVAANLRNRENRRIQIQANCEFKDAQGFVVESTPWQTVFLDENAQEGIRFVSSSDKALRYTIRVREAR